MEISWFPHQLKVLDETDQFNRVAYFLDMGLGKTFVGSEKLWELNAPYNLVICQKSQIEDWIHHFKNYYPEYKVVQFTTQEHFYKDTIYITNYELAWRRPQLKRLTNFTLLLDESSKIKNESTKQSKFILSLRPKNVILLSGTPTGGKYEELWSQCKLLGWNINKKQFLNTYTIRVKNQFFQGFKIVGYKNVERLKRKLRQFGAVFMKTEEVFDLPSQTVIEINCKTPDEYFEFKTNHYLKTDDREFIGDTPLTARLYLRQLAGHLNTNKVERLKEILESTADRVIIFYNWTVEYELISELCKTLKKPISVIKGGLVDKLAYEKHENSVTLVQYDAGSMGHNLQKSNKIIYFTLPDKSIAFEQSKKRIHRIGQNYPCFYYYLLTEQSIEESVLKTLTMRKDYTDELFKEEFNYDY